MRARGERRDGKVGIGAAVPRPMWARRCGAPPTWPSRVKVLFFSFFSGTVGLSIYLYMNGSNISYLALDQPATVNVLCLTEWPQRSHVVSWSDPGEWFKALFAVNNDDLKELRSTRACAIPGEEPMRCENIKVSVHDINRPIALAMGDSFARYDILSMWARFFLCITFAVWAGMTVHDLALIGRAQKDFILDVTGVNRHCPSLRAVWRSLAGIKLLKRLVATDARAHVRIIGRVIAVLIAPVVVVWNLVVFNFIIVPLLMIAFLRYPIRMSRAWVFIVSCACSLYGLAMTAHQLAYVASPDLRPRYAVTWTHDPFAANATSTGLTSCTCGCDYPISFNVCMNLSLIGAVTIMKSIFVAFRCLKGLRRSQWANLLSVLFPVPITMYAVDWQTPDGKPIKHRVEGVPVQAEVAFDPFAMMDEQPDSKFTTIHLRPEPLGTWTTVDGEMRLTKGGRQIEAPSPPIACDDESDLDHGSPRNRYQREMEYIGCCGFPWPTGGFQAVFKPQYLEQVSHASLSMGGSPVAGSSPSKTPRSVHEAGLSRSTVSFDRSDSSPTSLRLELKGPLGVRLNLTDGRLQMDNRWDDASIQEPRGRGAPGMLLCAAQVRRPRDHTPPAFDRRVSGGVLTGEGVSAGRLGAVWPLRVALTMAHASGAAATAGSAYVPKLVAFRALALRERERVPASALAPAACTSQSTYRDFPSAQG
eukprot:CAMPEP_0195054068 /NCGR_PEP_ID=MMETSP0448-20130528/3047_1 /TAXON_ID=66468 /ORGANISM="Heterocapsa triquestra, Strain CCMP 448" /LENGTH=701 /DNA_ID=CAMNT_0040083477 /DNA_START=208 /DNA_END=2309 /DNA_ORIENTATION=+